MDSNPPSSTTITDPISSLLNPNPTFFNLPHPNQPFTSFVPVQNTNMFINHHANTNTGQDSNNHHVGVSIKNPKKRTRASRKTPTTVLTTDTNNFRQMVQEFTGIPTAPFSGGLDGSRISSMMGLQNPMFGFQSLLQRKLGDDAQLVGSSCSTRYDEVDKLNSLCFDDETEEGLETGFIKRQ